MYLLPSRRVLLVILLLIICTLLLGIFAHAAPRTATDADKAAIEAAGLTYTKNMLWDPANPYVGMSVSDAKRYLLSVAKGLDGTRAAPNEERIGRLNDTFAKCAAQFLKAYSDRYGPVVVRSAFRCGPRSPKEIRCNRDENENAGGASGSNHEAGLALDVNPAGGKSSYQTLWNFASENPQFGVCFPHQNGGTNTTGYRDNPHMILAGIGGRESAACTKQGVKKPCDGTKFDPKTVAERAGAPSSRISDTVRQAVNSGPAASPSYQQAPAQQQPQEQMCALPDGRQVPCSAIANNQTQPAGGPQPTGAPAPQQQALPQNQQPFQSPQAAVTPTQYTDVTTTTRSTTELLDALKPPATSSADRPSAIDQINEIANPSPAPAGNVSDTLILTVSDSDAEVLEDEISTQEVTREESTTTEVTSPSAQQTFTSADLSFDPNVSYQQPQNTFLLSTLAELQETLRTILAYMRPFGRPHIVD